MVFIGGKTNVASLAAQRSGACLTLGVPWLIAHPQYLRAKHGV